MKECHFGLPPVRPFVFIPGWGNVWRCRYCLASVGPREKGAGVRVEGKGFWMETGA